MIPAKSKSKAPYRKRRLAKSVALPHWLVSTVFLITGFLLWAGALSDTSGRLRTPGIGSVLYLIALAAIAGSMLHGEPSRPRRPSKPLEEERRMPLEAIRKTHERQS